MVTFFNFLAMAFGALVVLGASQINSLPLFIVGFVMLFIFSGIGNGSTYKMIPAIFHAKAQLEVSAGLDLLEADRRAIRRAGALIGLAGAIGALGGVMVNLAFRQSFLTLQNGDGAYIAFIAFYVVCCLVTWVVFMRQRPGRLLGGLVARLPGGVGVERGRDGDAPLSVRSGDELVGVAFQVYRCSTAIEILQYEPADPDTGHLNVGHNLASAYALDSTAAVEVLALGEEVT